MDRLEFYKEMYFNEAEIKHKLEDKVTIPMGILTVIVSVHAYIFASTIQSLPLFTIQYSSFFILLFMTISLYYLGRSFMNLGKTHVYKEIASMTAFMEYDLKLKAHNREAEYEQYLEKEFAECASHNRAINIQRTKDLAKCKVYLFFCLLLTFFNSLMYITDILIKSK